MPLKKRTAACLCAAVLLNGTVLQMPASAGTLTAETQAYYTMWKEAYLRQNPYSDGETQYYVFYGEQTYEEAQETVPVTVS